MDEIYRGFRIAVKRTGSWTARITASRGSVIPITAHASDDEGPMVCLVRARDEIDRYLGFLDTKYKGNDDGYDAR